MTIETTVAFKSKDSDRRFKMCSAPNYGIKLTEEHVPLSFSKNPLQDPFLFLSITPHFLILKNCHAVKWTSFGACVLSCSVVSDSLKLQQL